MTTATKADAADKSPFCRTAPFCRAVMVLFLLMALDGDDRWIFRPPQQASSVRLHAEAPALAPGLGRLLTNHQLVACMLRLPTSCLRAGTDEPHFGRGAIAFAEAVAADPVLNGTFEIEVFGNAQLNDDLSVLDGCIKGTLDGAFSSNLYEVQKYLRLTGHIYDGLGFIASADLLENLSEAQRTALAACARKGAVVTRQGDEVGAMACAVQVLKDSAIEKVRIERQSEMDREATEQALACAREILATPVQNRPNRTLPRLCARANRRGDFAEIEARTGVRLAQPHLSALLRKGASDGGGPATA